MIYNRKKRFGVKQVEEVPQPVKPIDNEVVEKPDIDNMKFFELKAYAKEQGMVVDNSTNKEEILNFLKGE